MRFILCIVLVMLLPASALAAKGSGAISLSRAQAAAARGEIRRKAPPIHGNSPKNGILDVFDRTRLLISPAMTSVCPKFISTCVSTFRVLKPFTVVPFNVTAVEPENPLPAMRTRVPGEPLLGRTR